MRKTSGLRARILNGTFKILLLLQSSFPLSPSAITVSLKSLCGKYLHQCFWCETWRLGTRRGGDDDKMLSSWCEFPTLTAADEGSYGRSRTKSGHREIVS